MVVRMIQLRWLDAPMLVTDRPLPEGFRMSVPRRMILQYRDGDQEWKEVPSVLYEKIYGPTK